MKFFLRHFLPVTYFQSTRLNRWALVGYNALVEWFPALALSFFYNNYDLSIIPVVVLSYLGFICIYEIGYITNDFFSERFETEPRGRAKNLPASSAWVGAIIGTRIVFFLAFTYLLGAVDSVLWWVFYGTLATTFALHNVLPSAWRIPTFFGLSTYRYFAPIIIALSPAVLTVLIPALILNNSLYRTTVYLRNKNGDPGDMSGDMGFKLLFYVSCLPFSVMLAVFFDSPLPVVVCIYFLSIWVLFWAATWLFKIDKKVWR